MKIVFRTFNIFVLVLISHLIQAQAPDNDNCSSAQTIPVGFTTQWVSSTLEGALPSTGAIVQDSLVCNIGVRNTQRDVWFTFPLTKRRFKVKFKSIMGSFTWQVYYGKCDSLVQVKCKSYANSQANTIDSVTVGPIPAGVTGFLRVYKISSVPVGVTPFELSVELLNVPNILRSKVPGGLWSQTSTWEAGIIPVANDSVQISENTTVDMDVNFSIKKPLAWIRIGGEDSNKVARLKASQILTKSEFTIGKKDTLYGKVSIAPGIKYVWIYTPGNVYVGGAIKSDQMGLEFVGKGNQLQRFYGPGILKDNLVNGFRLNNPGGVEIDFPLRFMNSIYVLQGELKFNKPGRHILGQNSILGDTLNQTIVRYLGKITGDFGFLPSSGFFSGPQFSLSLLYGLPGDVAADEPYLKNLIDTSRRLGQEVYWDRTDKISLTVGLNRVQGYKEISGNQFFHGIGSTLSKIKSLGVNDTIFGRDMGTPPIYIQDGGFENSTICFQGKPYPLRIDSGIVSQSNHLIRNGREMMGGICGVNNMTLPPDQKICYQLVPQSPTGSFPAPITALQGKTVFYISSNKALSPGIFRVSLSVADRDSMVGNPYDFRICQSVSPNGPWKVVSDSIQPDYNINNVKARISKPLNWAEGSYFCWATTAKNFDASVEELIPPPSYSVGCGNETYKKVGLVIKNHGVQNITGSFSVGYQFENQFPRNYQVTFPVGQSVKPLKTDTIYLESLFGLQLPDHKMWPYKAWIHLPGDARPENDTLRRNVNYKPMPLPYLQNFDTIPSEIHIQPSFSFYAPNLPYRWFDSVRYQRIVDFENNFENTFRVRRLVPTSPTDFGIFSLRGTVGKQVLFSEPIGPIVNPSFWKFKYKLNTVNIGDSIYLRSKDTVAFEASADCGLTWERLWVQHNQDQFTGSVPQWYGDSLPYPPGTVLVFRWVENFQTFRPVPQIMPNMTFDSLIVKAGLYTEVAPPIENRKEMIRLYPNPGSGSFRMMGPENWLNQELELSVFDLMGRSVWSEKRKFQNEEIQLPASVKAGLYMIRIRKGNTMISVPYLVDPGR